LFFFGKKDPGRESTEAKAKVTIDALTQGKIPAYVEERIASQKHGDLPWTSDLSVNEWLTMSSLQVKPLGLVMGSSFFHIGFTISDYRGNFSSGPIFALENAIQESRRLALSRLAQEAKQMGANAVVGVCIHEKKISYDSHETEFSAVGTGVFIDFLPKDGSVLLSCVSGQDFFKLYQVGYLSVGIALGVSVWYDYTTFQDARIAEYSYYNQEMSQFSRAMHTTRSRAVQSLQQQAKQVQGGVLAHDTSVHVRRIEVSRGQDDERVDHAIEYVALGTIIKPFKPNHSLNVLPILKLKK